MLKALQLVLAGERYLPIEYETNEVMPSYYNGADRSKSNGALPPYTQALESDTVDPLRMTVREREVLAHLARGCTTRKLPTRSTFNWRLSNFMSGGFAGRWAPATGPKRRSRRGSSALRRLRDIGAFLAGAMEWRVLKNPKFLFPVAAIFVFAVAALSSTVRFLDEEEGLFSYALEQSVAVGELEDQFHDFEESVFLYASGHPEITPEELLKKIANFRGEIEKFMGSDWASLRPGIYPSLKSLGEIFIVIEHSLRSSGFLQNRKLSVGMARPFLEAHEALEALDADSTLREARMGTYRRSVRSGGSVSSGP